MKGMHIKTSSLIASIVPKPSEF